MADKKRGLGRGFDALIPTDLIDEEFDPTAKTTAGGKRVAAEMVQLIDPAAIEPNPHQPRQIFDEAQLQSLAESIKLHGILQPVVVSEVGAGKYQLIAGERRVRAAKIAGEQTVPAIVRSFSEQQKLELALIENLQRQDLNPIETATAYKKLIDEFNVQQGELAKRVGRDQSTISNTIRLLGLPLEAKRALATGKISEGHARQILSVSGIERQLALLDLIIKNGWTVRQAEAFARDFKAPTASKEKAIERVSDTNDLTKDLGAYLGTKVTIYRTAKGGKLQIEYYSDEELDRIYRAIKRLED